MALAPDKPKTTLADLARMGMEGIKTWGIEFDPPPGARGLHKNMRVTMWKCCITTLDPARPMIVAVRPDPVSAETVAKALFVEMIGRKVPTSGPTQSVPENYEKAKPKPAAAAPKPDDDDGMDLI